jgi:hypothetical protein
VRKGLYLSCHVPVFDLSNQRLRTCPAEAVITYPEEIRKQTAVRREIRGRCSDLTEYHLRDRNKVKNV